MTEESLISKLARASRQHWLGSSFSPTKKVENRDFGIPLQILTKSPCNEVDYGGTLVTSIGDEISGSVPISLYALGPGKICGFVMLLNRRSNCALSAVK